MPNRLISLGQILWDLPPLILHPFNERASAASLLENSRAALMLSGLIPNDGSDPGELQRRILAGRHGEIRMLFLLGKDVFRWMDQCADWAVRIPELAAAGIFPQSFAGFVTLDPPESVKEKLTAWGVMDHAAIFSRAIGLNAVFGEPPTFGQVSEEFLRNYQRYTDSAYRCYMAAEPHRTITSANFQFTLYASGEYSRILESQWSDK